MMKAIAICASARKGGNTALAARRVIDAAEQHGMAFDLVELEPGSIKPCRACWACADKGNCIQGDDRFQELFERMKMADALLFASPVYSANISSTMQAVLERAAVVCDMNRGLLAHKAGAALAVGRRAGTIPAMNVMLDFFVGHDMFVAGSTYWPIAYGRLPGEVKQDEEGMKTMQRLGENLAILTNALGGAR